jgi:hypothetical protein
MSFSSLRGRLGAHTLHATHDSQDLIAKARVAVCARFEQAVDPAPVLPELERQQRAEQAKRAYLTSLARTSAEARRISAKVPS